MVELPDRGSTYVIDVPGPVGAPTLVLLHALACTAHLSWYPTIGALSEHFRVVAFDQRWHGRGIQSDDFRLSDCADDVAALLDLLGIETAIIGGYSMGGAIAQLVWKQHRSRVDGLVLAATARNFRGRAVERAWFAMTRTAMGRFSERAKAGVERAALKLSDPVHDVPDEALAGWAFGQFRSTSRWAMLAVLDEIGRFDSSTWIGQVRVPTSVVVATNDIVIPTHRQHRLAESIPLAMSYEFAGNHAGMVLGADRFVPTFVEACLSVTRRRAAGKKSA
jgi:pimeloyl-ACP methyl ester carboxylesterase